MILRVDETENMNQIYESQETEQFYPGVLDELFQNEQKRDTKNEIKRYLDQRNGGYVQADQFEERKQEI